ncbi:Hypothetical protein EIN_243670, partial [Entamoeba invadens IP1]
MTKVIKILSGFYIHHFFKKFLLKLKNKINQFKYSNLHKQQRCVCVELLRIPIT